ncbi:MAG: type IV secretion protein IcmB, partial [Gammaproteobacteria bacterium]
MASIIDPVLDTIDSFLGWISTSLKQTTESYCELETADSDHVLVAYDGSLVSLLKIDGVKALVGTPEFERLHEGINLSLQSAMSRPGHAIQFLFHYDKERAPDLIQNIFSPAQATAQELRLELSDLFSERVKFLSEYCAQESLYFVLWTRPTVLTSDQNKKAIEKKSEFIKANKIPAFTRTQNVMAAIPDLRDSHESFVRATVNDLSALNIQLDVLPVHEAVYEMRKIVDPEFTAREWRPVLPGDKITVKDYKRFTGDLSDLLWPPLARQIFPRDAENLDLKTVKIGDKIYSSVFIDLFPKDIKMFVSLFQRTLAARIPWRMSFFTESNGLSSIRLKAMFASILSFTSEQNRLLSDANNLLKYININ